MVCQCSQAECVCPHRPTPYDCKQCGTRHVHEAGCPGVAGPSGPLVRVVAKHSPRLIVDSWVRPANGQHWLVQLVVLDSDGGEPRLVCFRNGVRAIFNASDVEID